jgi:ubiquinone/menaquinone biosynthesis C-methylase UbiE
MTDKNKIFSVAKSKSLDNIYRGRLQNPEKIIQPFLRPGMTVLDLGCGPGFFTIPMAESVGANGRVVACDIQEGMLEKLNMKIQGNRLKDVVILHKCAEQQIGVSGIFDFILGFYMLHEVPDQEIYLKEIASLLKSSGRFLLFEPTFKVSKNEFNEVVNKAAAVGLKKVGSPRIVLGRTAVFGK